MAYRAFRVILSAPRHRAILYRWQTMFEQEADDLADLFRTLIDAVPRARAVAIPPPGPVNGALQQGLFIQALLQNLLAHSAARLAKLTDEAERLAPPVESLRDAMDALERASIEKDNRTSLQ
jgi:hypothetical protein